jgi:hypothetical protein
MSITSFNNIHQFLFMINTVYCVVGKELRIIISVNLRRPNFTVYLCKIFKLETVGEGAILEHFLYLTHKVVIYHLMAVKHVNEMARALFCKK